VVHGVLERPVHIDGLAHQSATAPFEDFDGEEVMNLIIDL